MPTCGDTMARVCNQCKAYDAEGALQTCPTCHIPMQFTLLPPQNAPVAPLTLSESTSQPLARHQSATAGSQSFESLAGLVFRYRLFAGLVAIPLLVLGGFLGFNFNSGSSLKARYDQLKVGMEIQQVEDILSPPARYHGRIVTQHHLLDCVPDEGPYSMEYTEQDSGTIMLDFEDGVLVGKSQHGVK